MTPYEIGLILHYYYSAEDHEDIQRNPPVTRPTLLSFVEHGLLVYRHDSERQVDDAMYAITERGTAYCKALQRVQLPIQIWIQPGEDQRA